MTDVASVVEFEVTEEAQENTQLSREAIIQLGRFERLYRRLHNQRKKLFLPEDTLADFVPKKKDKKIVQLHLAKEEILGFVKFLEDRIEKYKKFADKEIIVDENDPDHVSHSFIRMQEEAQKSVAFLEPILTAIKEAEYQNPIEIAVLPIRYPKSKPTKGKDKKDSEKNNPKKKENAIEYKFIHDYLTAVIKLFDDVFDVSAEQNDVFRASVRDSGKATRNYDRVSAKFGRQRPSEHDIKTPPTDDAKTVVSYTSSRASTVIAPSSPHNGDFIEDLDLSHLDELVLQVDALTMSSVAVKNAIEESDIAAYKLQYGNKVRNLEKRTLDENEKIIRAALPFLQFFEKNYTKRFTQAILTTETRRNTTYLNTHASRVYPSSGVLRGLQNAWNAFKIVAGKLRWFFPGSWVGFHTFFVHPAIAKRARRDIRQKEALQGKVLEAFVTLCVAKKYTNPKAKQKLLAEAIDLVRARNKFVAQLIVDEGRRIVGNIPNDNVKQQAQRALEKLIAQVEEDILKDSSDEKDFDADVFKKLEKALLKHFEGSQSPEVQEVKGELKAWLNTIKDAEKRKDKKEQHYNTIKEQHIRVPGYLYRFQRREPSTDAPQPDTSLMATAQSEFRTLHRNFAAVSKKALRKVPKNQQVEVQNALQELGALALAHQHQQAVRAALPPSEANAALKNQTEAMENFLKKKKELATLLGGDAAEKIIRQTLYRAPEVKKAVEHLNKRVEKYRKEKLEKQSEVITTFKGERFAIREKGKKSKRKLIRWLEALEADLANCYLDDQQQLATNTLLTAAIAELNQNEEKYKEKSNVVIYKLKLVESLEKLNLGKVPKWLNDDTGKDGVKGVASKRAIKQQPKKPWYKKASLSFLSFKKSSKKRVVELLDPTDLNHLGEAGATNRVILEHHLAWYILKQQEVQFWKALRVPSLKIKTLQEKDIELSKENTSADDAKSMHTTITTLITDIEKGFEEPIEEFSESIEGTPLQAITGIKKAIRDKLNEEKYAALVAKPNDDISKDDAPALKELGNELIHVIKKEREAMMKDVETLTFHKKPSKEITTEAKKMLKSKSINFGASLNNTIETYKKDVTHKVKSFETHVKEEGRGGIQSAQPPVLNMHDPITYLGELILGVKINEKVLEIKDPKSDGNCLHRAVADSLVGDKRLTEEGKHPYQKVKELCLKDIENNPEMYANIIQGTIAEQSQSADTGAFTATTYIKNGIKTQYTQQQHLASKNSATNYEEVIDEKFRALTKVDAKGNSIKLTEGEKKLLVEAYVKGMRQNPNAWGDNAIIKAVVEVFKINVNIYKKDGNRLIFVMTSTPEKKEDRTENTIDLLYTGNHYQSIVPSGRRKSLVKGNKELKKKDLPKLN